MNISITARKTTVKDSFREKVEKKLRKLDRFFDDEAKAVVTVTNERERETVEVTITYRGMIFARRRRRQTGPIRLTQFVIFSLSRLSRTSRNWKPRFAPVPLRTFLPRKQGSRRAPIIW